MPDYSGLSIGRYHIIEPLGQGGMATVYRAFDTRLECDVAVKFIRMERLTGEEKERALKRFEREAKELARLTHPNIVKVTDFGKFRGNPYLVMEYLSGGTIKELAGKLLPYDQAAHLLAPVARALEYAHEKNLIHRDIKPGNILLTDRGQPMVSDFGIAKILDPEGGHTLTSTNMAIGTPEYMAPEQWLSQASAQSDIYALGVVFYELITGKRPYTADTPAAIFLKQATDPLPRPRAFVPGLPDGVEKVLFKALAKKPEERYASMGEFAAALEGLANPAKEVPSAPVQPKLAAPEIAIPLPEAPTTIANRPQPQDLQIKESIQAKPVSPQEDLGSLSPTSDVSIPIALPPKANPAPSRRGWVWMGVGAIVLLGAIALIVWGIGKSNSNPAPTQTVAVQAALPSPTPTPKAQTTPTLGVGLIQVSSKDGMMQMYVPAGDFLMGSDKAKDLQAYANEMPQHTVYLDAYWIDRTEVNNGQYRRCVTLGACGAPGNMGSTIRSSYFLDTRFAYYPVIYVNWTQAKAYCTWAGRRLPSEAEWEKAARGTDGLTYPWGNETPNQNLLNFNQNLSDTTKVGNYPSGASPYGALDMAGNVWEWVNDWYADNFYQESPAHNPTGPGPKYLHVTRGGSWYYSNSLARSAYRNSSAPNTSNGDTGFRCAASITP